MDDTRQYVRGYAGRKNFLFLRKKKFFFAVLIENYVLGGNEYEEKVDELLS